MNEKPGKLPGIVGDGLRVEHHFLAQYRATALPETPVVPLRTRPDRVRRIRDSDPARGSGAVFLPCAPERKYPRATTICTRVLRRGGPGRLLWFIFSHTIVS